MNNQDKVKFPHDFSWDAESISSFWDEVSQEERTHHLYFTRHYAKYITALAKLSGLSSGSVLDYGAGKGYLSKQLLQEGYEVTSLEFSEQSSKILNTELQSFPNWKGCTYANEIPTPLEANSFSFIFSIETYEHLLEEWIEPYFNELYRLTEPGGKILITTPFCENLDDQLIICPNCNSRFHRFQHLRSVNSEQLISRAESAGFSAIFCRAIDLASVGGLPHYTNWRNASFNSILYSIKYKYSSIKDKVMHRVFPDTVTVRNLSSGGHLVLIAHK
jgi:2-polyprenyl-3-methyl-5-hydroxy-6-metoxy-1,4-benzoquinol methylase